MDQVLAGLRAACGEEHARPATAQDVPAGVLDGVEPAYVAAPDSVEAAAGVLRTAADHGLAVLPRGGGTKLHWGVPPRRADLVVDTRRLDRVLEYAAGDLVVRAQAGTPLAVVAERAAAARQQLALDPPVPGGTLGGTVATGLAGPRRLRYGAPRDLLIGVTVVRADGVVARSGGKVVKNVAGYDLGKLYTGSYGTLGLLVETIFRLHPAPEAQRFVVTTCADETEAHCRVQAVLGAQVVPAAVEVAADLTGGPVTLAVLLEGVARGVEARVAATRALLGAGAEDQDAAPPGWGELPAPPGGVLLRCAAEVAALPLLLAGLRAAAASGLTGTVRGSAGVGVLYAGLPAASPPAAVAAAVAALRARLADVDGSVVVLAAPPAVCAALDVWGPVRGLDLMRRVKDQFDPDHRLAPGRFVGGI